MKMKLEI